eukprot:4299252-Prymnesium_polylepis.1
MRLFNFSSAALAPMNFERNSPGVRSANCVMPCFEKSGSDAMSVGSTTDSAASEVVRSISMSVASCNAFGE